MMPTTELDTDEFNLLKQAEDEAREIAMTMHTAAEEAFGLLSEVQKTTMTDDDDQVADFMVKRDNAYQARINFQDRSSERMMAEPSIRYKAGMDRQMAEPLSLMDAREMVFKMMYAQALVEEHELLSAVMVQGPERLEEHGQAMGKTDHFRELWQAALRTKEAIPEGTQVAPWSAMGNMDTGAEATEDDEPNGDEEE